METHAQTATRQIHEFYIAQINHLVADDRESLIDSLVEDFDRSSATAQERLTQTPDHADGVGP
jgi:hypothetical protein